MRPDPATPSYSTLLSALPPSSHLHHPFSLAHLTCHHPTPLHNSSSHGQPTTIHTFETVIKGIYYNFSPDLHGLVNDAQSSCHRHGTGVVVSTSAFQAGGPGSIPGCRKFCIVAEYFFSCFFSSLLGPQEWGREGTRKAVQRVISKRPRRARAPRYAETSASTA